jgi:hypothetical protein
MLKSNIHYRYFESPSITYMTCTKKRDNDVAHESYHNHMFGNEGSFICVNPG